MRNDFLIALFEHVLITWSNFCNADGHYTNCRHLHVAMRTRRQKKIFFEKKFWELPHMYNRRTSRYWTLITFALRPTSLFKICIYMKRTSFSLLFLHLISFSDWNETLNWAMPQHIVCMGSPLVWNGKMKEKKRDGGEREWVSKGEWK